MLTELLIFKSLLKSKANKASPLVPLFQLYTEQPQITNQFPFLIHKEANHTNYHEQSDFRKAQVSRR